MYQHWMLLDRRGYTKSSRFDFYLICIQLLFGFHLESTHRKSPKNRLYTVLGFIKSNWLCCFIENWHFLANDGLKLHIIFISSRRLNFSIPSFSPKWTCFYLPSVQLLSGFYWFSSSYLSSQIQSWVPTTW